MISFTFEKGKLTIVVDVAKDGWVSPEYLLQEFMNQQKGAGEPLEKTLEHLRDVRIALKSVLALKGPNYARKLVQTHTVRKNHAVFLGSWVNERDGIEADKLPEGSTVVYWGTEESDADTVYKD